jgi:CRP/FNR family cyclic AMP-dependent transcriptional regulator
MDDLFKIWGVDFQPGELIFHEGEEGEVMFIIQEGEVEIIKKFGNSERVVAVLRKGDFFGEMAIVSRVKRTATARAKTLVKMLCFDREGFQTMIEKNSKLTMTIIDKLCRRLERTTSQLAEFSQISIKSAIATFLIALKKLNPEQDFWNLNTTVEELSMMLQIPKELATEELMEFTKNGGIEVQNNFISIKNEEQIIKTITCC